MPMIFFLIAGLIVLSDQLLKCYIVHNFVVGETRVVIPHLLSFTYLQNDGAANNILSGKMWLFYLISIIVIPIVLYFIFKYGKQSRQNWLMLLGLAFVLGGTIGNFIDRLHLKYVVDMLQLDFMHFNIFNIADAAISVGILFIAIHLIFIEREQNETT